MLIKIQRQKKGKQIEAFFIHDAEGNARRRRGLKSGLGTQRRDSYEEMFDAELSTSAKSQESA